MTMQPQSQCSWGCKMMYGFVTKQWIMRLYTVDQVNLCVTKNYITQDQANIILATAQITS